MKKTCFICCRPICEKEGAYDFVTKPFKIDERMLMHIIAAELFKAVGNVVFNLRLQSLNYGFCLAKFEEAFVGKNCSEPETEKWISYLIKAFFDLAGFFSSTGISR